MIILDQLFISFYGLYRNESNLERSKGTSAAIGVSAILTFNLITLLLILQYLYPIFKGEEIKLFSVFGYIFIQIAVDIRYSAGKNNSPDGIINKFSKIPSVQLKLYRTLSIIYFGISVLSFLGMIYLFVR